MPKVLCTLPNASTLISGVAFTAHANGMLSEDVSEGVAAEVSAVPGYEVVGSVDRVAEAAALAAEQAEQAAAASAAEAEKADLLARADAVKLKTKGNWSIERLKSEVESAESAAEAAALAAAATPATTE